MIQLHKRRGRWQPSSRCYCGRGKIRFRSEAAALAAAGRASERLDSDFKVYKCPGSSAWHMRTRGFTPESLQSRPRIMAFHLSNRGAMTFQSLLAALGLPEFSDDRSIRRKIQHVRRVLEIFGALGLVTADDRKPPYYGVTDREGLFRVMMTGLDEYVSGLGISWAE